MTLPLTELNKLIAEATDGPWAADVELGEIELFAIRKNILGRDYADISNIYLYDDGTKQGTILKPDDAILIAASRTALPNALRVIAECKRVLERLRCESDGSDCYQAIDAVKMIEAFERDVLQQEKM